MKPQWLATTEVPSASPAKSTQNDIDDTIAGIDLTECDRNGVRDNSDRRPQLLD